jgi:hypothetical protein
LENLSIIVGILLAKLHPTLEKKPLKAFEIDLAKA